MARIRAAFILRFRAFRPGVGLGVGELTTGVDVGAGDGVGL